MLSTPVSRWIRTPFVWLFVSAWLCASAASAQQLAGQALEQALRGGGYVIVISNGQAQAEPPEERRRAWANFDGERELDDHGQGEMLVIGYAFRELDLKVDDTLTAPAYRSRQSATYFGFGKQAVAKELDESGDASWLTRRVSQAPSPGHNTVLITDASLIMKAFGRDARNFGTAETLIYRPREGRADLVARLTIADWAKLAVK